MKRKLVVGAVLAALMVGGYATYSWAAGSEAQTLNACVNKEGQLRLVAVADGCKSNETAISWNTVGPEGPQGPKGDTGATGPQGPAAPNPDGLDATAALTINGAALDTFDVLSVNHGVSVAREAGSGMATGRRMHKPFVITKRMDKSSPLLMKALVENRVVTGTFTLRQNGQAVATIKLTNARMSDYEQHGMTETWSFVYQKIEWTWLDGNVTEEDDWSSST